MNLGKKDKNIIEPCLGIKVFTWSIVFLSVIALIFEISVMIIYSDYSLVYFFSTICIVGTNLLLVCEMVGTKLIIKTDSIEIVKRFFLKTEIKILDISGYKCSFMTTGKGEYPDNLKIYHKDQKTNFNEGLCSKKDMKNYFLFLKQMQ